LRVLGRDQSSAIRAQMASRPAMRPTPCCSDLRSLISDLCAVRRHRPCRCPRTGSTYPCPGPTSPRGIPRNDGRTCFTVTTRFTISREQRTENTGQTTRSITPILRHNSRSRCQKTRPGTFLSSVLLPSAI
jgi:hypothetical protein